jgi:AraC-like DNA-binding protein
LSAQQLNRLGNPIIRNYTPQEYHGYIQNWSLIQNSQNILYVANTNILEFDGNFWKSIVIPKDKRVRCFAKDTAETIFVGADSDFGRLMVDKTGKMVFQSFLPLLEEKDRDFLSIWSCHCLGNAVYFVSEKKIFYYLNDSIQVIQLSQAIYGYVVHNQLFVITKNGIFRINGIESVLLPQTQDVDDHSYRWRGILPFQNKLLLVSENRGFFVYHLDLAQVIIKNPSKKDITFLSPFECKVSNYIRENLINRVAAHPFGYFMLLTKLGGIVITDLNCQSIKIINKNNGLQDNRVHDVIVDKSGNIWAALNYGIAYIEISSPISKWNEFNSINEPVICFAFYNNYLYIGNYGGVNSLSYDRNSNENIQENFQNVENIKDHCFFLKPTKIGLLAGGANVYRINQNSAQNLYPCKEGLFWLHESRQFPDILFIGKVNGINALKIESSQSKPPVLSKIFDFPEIKYAIRQIEEDHYGNLWLIAEYNGLVYVRFKQGKLTKYDIHYFREAKGLKNLDINYLFFENKKLLITSSQGIRSLAPEMMNSAAVEAMEFDTEPRFNQLNSYPDGVLYNLFKDENKKSYWVSSSMGPVRLIRDSVSGNYKWNYAEYSKINEFITAIFIDPNQTTMLGSAKGVFLINPNIPGNDTLAFFVNVRKVFDKSGRIWFNGCFYDPAYPDGDHFQKIQLIQPAAMIPTIPFKDNTIGFEYAAFFYESNDRNHYTTMLDGFDPGWSQWTRDCKREYTNLENGQYCFKVKARNIYHTESNIASFHLKISPPWYRSMPMYGVYVIFMVFLVFAVKRFISYQMERMLAQQQQKYKTNYLDPKLAVQYLEKLLKYMEGEKPYLNPDLNIRKLSAKLQLPSYHISQVINDKLNKNFNEFINHYRVNEAKELLRNTPSDKINILDLAFDVGFNTKSSFYNAFQKETGMAPLKYRKIVSQNQPLDNNKE